MTMTVLYTRFLASGQRLSQYCLLAVCLTVLTVGCKPSVGTDDYPGVTSSTAVGGCSSGCEHCANAAAAGELCEPVVPSDVSDVEVPMLPAATVKPDDEAIDSEPNDEDVDPDAEDNGFTFRDPEEGLPELGPALVDDPDSLLMLDPKDKIWLTKDRKSLVAQGRICQRNSMLEFFAVTNRGKTHESVVMLNVKPTVVQAGLLAAGAEPGQPVEFHPEFKPPSGPVVEIEVRWTDEDGKRQSRTAQEMILNMQTEEPMTEQFVFTGSRFVKHPDTGEEFFLASREGDLVSVANFPSAILDIAGRSSDQASMQMFRANEDMIPELGTSVTLVLTPAVDSGDN